MYNLSHVKSEGTYTPVFVNICRRLALSAGAAAKRRGCIRSDFLAKHTSRSFHVILRIVAIHSANDLHAVLCRAVCVSVPLVVSMMLTASCVTCKIYGFLSFHQFSWLVVTLRRCVGKQTSSGPTSPFSGRGKQPSEHKDMLEFAGRDFHCSPFF